MQTYLKLKASFRFFIAFLKSTLNFKYLEKKDQSQSLSITEIIICETDSYLNVQKAIFHATLRRPSGCGSQTLLRSPRNQVHTGLPLI